MKKNFRVIADRRLSVVLLSVFLIQGCGRENAVYFDTAVPETEVLCEETVDTGEAVQTEDAGEAVCYVYVCGAVVNPGVYCLLSGNRIYEAVELAGGLTPEAEITAVNQAEPVADGQMIWIPAVGETTSNAALETYGASAEDGRININTATQGELMTLSGIGESKAKSIVAYRTEHGNFASIEDLMKVEGIKEGVFNRVKDNIKVN